MTEEAERLVERWQGAASEGRSVDLYPEMVGITSRIIGRILFGADVSRALPELTRFSIVNEELLRRAVSPHPMPRWLPTSHNRRLTHELAQVRGIVDEIIAERQSAELRSPSGGSADDMLGLLLAARRRERLRPAHGDRSHQPGAALPHRGPRDDRDDARLHARPARAHPGVADETARGDRRSGCTDGRRRPRTSRSWTWTDRFLRECMRLFPGAYGMNRSTRDDETLAGCPHSGWILGRGVDVGHSPFRGRVART